MAKETKKTRKPRKTATRKSDPEQTIITATMELAAERDWRGITLRDIAEAAHMPLSELRAHIACKGDVLRALARRTDEALLDSVNKEPLEGEPTDRLFELIMRRLELMAPYKAAIARLMEEPAPAACECPPLIEQYFLAQRWMLAAAGLEKPGMEGLARTFGLGTVYARALRAWVKDDDPGLSTTMARLDKDLKRGAHLLARLQAPASAARSACRLARSILRTAASAARSSRKPAPEDATAAS